MIYLLIPLYLALCWCILNLGEDGGTKRKTMKLKTLAVIIQTQDDEIYQVALTKEELMTVESLIFTMQGQSIKILPHKLDGIQINKIETNPTQP